MLSSLVSAVRTPSDLTPVFTALGYVPDDTPGPDAWRGVARWKAYRVLAAAAREPRIAAREAAQRFAMHARPSLFAALGAGELALSATGPGGPGHRLLVIPLEKPPTLALERLEALRPKPTSNTLSHALHVADQLATEIAGERFYAGFRTRLDRMADAIDHRHTAADRQMVALLALTRVLFLYFVQAKGWLDGRADYLRTLLDDCLARHRHFHREALQPLFFGTLNTPTDRRRPHPLLGRIPYLNGGLFEPHPVERRVGSVTFANDRWRDAFDGLFERFHFCVREADEVDAIAPDMLGRVFERVMATDQRHQSGTFYTPESVVRTVVAATLHTALSGPDRLSESEAHAVLAGAPLAPRSRLRAGRALRALRVLDIAVGSGAFLLEALEQLAAAHVAAAPGTARSSPREIRRRVLCENLFGVDVSPVAVRLAELRLWLAVIADDPTDDIGAIEPLPNLDGLVRQGDSLLDPIAAARAMGLPSAPPAEASSAVAVARDALFNARGPARRAAQEALRAAEERLATQITADAERRVRDAIVDLAAVARGRDLFGNRSGLTEPQRRRHVALRRRYADLRAARRALAEGRVPFFAFDVHRPDVIAAGGFTVVVGNPPWVRAERLSEPERAALKDRFTWWRAGSGRGFVHLPDLSVAFAERALELAAPGGVVGLLVPSKLASAGYGASLRAGLVREMSIAYLHRIPDQEAARFGATTYPLAIVARKGPARPHHRVHLSFDRQRSTSQTALRTTGPWLLVGDRERAALDRFLESGTPLGAVGRPALGVKTGADRLFVGKVVAHRAETATVRFASTTVELEESVLRPALRGRDISPFGASPEVVLLWLHGENGRPLAELPPLAAAYVSTIERTLRARADFRGGPIWMLFRTEPSRARSLVVWRDITRRPAAVNVRRAAPQAIPLNSCYVLPTEDDETADLVAATLNSTWAAAAVRVLADEARGGYRRFNATVASRLPIPSRSRARDALIPWSAEAHHRDRFDQDTLDEIVADALGLSRADRRTLAGLDDDRR